MLRESDILGALRAGEVGLPPLRIQLAGVEPALDAPGRSMRPDAYVDVLWDGRIARFVAELEVRTTPKTFRGAVEQVRAYAEAS
ncbi:MAG: hypothetical protein KDA28_03950, partial [Phycisphaerales bacterium]|nr:hypothetical protein [Phycisphaerales bacterium]